MIPPVFYGYVVGSEFSGADNVGAVLGERVLLYDNIYTVNASKISSLCSEKGITTSELYTELNIDPNNITDPDVDKIAEYFGVKIDELYSVRNTTGSITMDWYTEGSVLGGDITGGSVNDSTIPSRDDRCEELFLITCSLSAGMNYIDISAPINNYDRKLQFAAIDVITTQLGYNKTRYSYNESTNGNAVTAIITIDCNAACDARIEIVFRSLNPNV